MACASAFLLALLTTTVYGGCPGDYPHSKLTFLYESFKCEPNCSNENNCPVEYKCVDIAANNSVCYFNGNFYKPEEGIKSSLTWERCMGCTCAQDNGNPATVVCYYADCPMPNVTEGCRLKEELGECCYASQVCPPFQTCTIAKQRFLEGDKFIHPAEKCTKCYCGKGAGGVGVVKCEKQYCLDLLLFQDEIRRKCAPLYQETDVCCPSAWICPEDDITFEEDHDPGTGPYCMFGTKLLSKGKKFRSSGTWGNTSCECVIPPYASCETTENI